ncbi:MAG: 3'(2'),5'-bisphosphate nucleotidase CysQ [Acidimicrobiia bacterium]|nr:3'(2'),5'-bisphosphate nucleotidase CysQ [Acidimicrobiia bacterium]
MIDDHQLAGLAAQVTGEVLVELRHEAFDEGWMIWQVRDEGDRQAHNRLIEELAAARPDDVVLSEEAADDRRRLDAERVWIIDPLDGTVDYSSPYSDDFAVHVALVEGGEAVAAAVSLPARGRLFGTAASSRPMSPGRERPVVIASRAQAHWGHALAEDLDGEVITAGSAGVKAMAVVEGTADVYIHPTGLYEWDVCAPAAVAAAAGLFVSGIDGSELVFNQSRPVVPGLVVSRPELADRVLRALNG